MRLELLAWVAKNLYTDLFDTVELKRKLRASTQSETQNKFWAVTFAIHCEDADIRVWYSNAVVEWVATVALSTQMPAVGFPDGAWGVDNHSSIILTEKQVEEISLVSDVGTRLRITPVS